MKITKTQLKQIIKEELKAVMEVAPPQLQSYEPREVEQYLPKVYDEFGPYIEDGDLTIALQADGGGHFYKIKGGQFKPTGEISNATGGLPAEVEDIRLALEQIPEPDIDTHLEPDLGYYESINREELEQILNEIQIAPVLSGITRQGGRRLKAIELTEKYFVELSKLGLAADSIKLITDFMKGLHNAKQALSQQQQT